MKHKVWAAAGLMCAAASAVTPGYAQDAPSPKELSGIAAFGKELYDARCSNCHSNTAGESSLAPTLHGVIGRKAGGVEGFPYSQKLTGLDFNWDKESLGGWLASQSLEFPDPAHAPPRRGRPRRAAVARRVSRHAQGLRPACGEYRALFSLG